MMDYLINQSTNPYFNMAFDNFCLESLDNQAPVFYLWKNRPSVIIGLNQNAYSEVNLKFLKDNNIDLVRRVTGGGAVYHDLQNLNYTIVGRSKDMNRDCPGYLHLMLDAVRDLGVDACASGRNDILVDGKKISGYAKRVWKDRLMIHGTLMYDVDIETLARALDTPGSKMSGKGVASVRSRVANLKDFLPQFHDIDSLQSALQSILAGDGKEIKLSSEQYRTVEVSATTEFAVWQWNYGHSREADIARKGLFPCGTVEALIQTDGGRVRGLRFGGDFLGNLPADELAEMLVGRRLDTDDIVSALKAADVSMYFDGLSVQELAGFIAVG